MWVRFTDASCYAIFELWDYSSCCWVPEEGRGLLEQWNDLCYPADKMIAGVLADWLEENRSEIVPKSEEASACLDEFISGLRLRCHFLSDNVEDFLTTLRSNE